MTAIDDEFEDIRPYNDAQVRSTLDRLLADPEFLNAIIYYKWPDIGRLSASLLRPVIRAALRRELKGVNSVADFQGKIEKYLQRLIDRTVTGLSVSGLEQLQKDRAYCFISNHRDITMDPAFVNWQLYQNGFQTLRIAIGDNLLTKPFASDLMRLNKSFIVKRSASSPREKLKAAKKLSAYIHQSLVVDNANIWIAQREGRAKDGRDISNPAIISMLALSKQKQEPFSAFMQRANIVPVSISYEWDPCDMAKARELTLLQRDGVYRKAEHEDVQSIATGITGRKGHVHLAFGRPLDTNVQSVEDVAAALDRTILDNYVLHPSNCLAYEMLEKTAPPVPVTAAHIPFGERSWNQERQHLEERYQGCDPAWRQMLLTIYANPVYAKLAQNQPGSH